MGQIVSLAAKPKRCNLNQLSQVPTPAAGEHILVSSDNSMNAAGQGNFDCYIIGDGSTAATSLTLHPLADETPTEDSKNSVTSGGVYKTIADDEEVLFAALYELKETKAEKSEIPSLDTAELVAATALNDIKDNIVPNNFIQAYSQQELLLDTQNITKSGLVQNDGSVAGVAGDGNYYLIHNSNYTKVHITLKVRSVTFTTNNVCAVAFFSSSEDISTQTLISSVDASATLDTFVNYYANVPSGTKIICVNAGGNGNTLYDGQSFTLYRDIRTINFRPIVDSLTNNATDKMLSANAGSELLADMFHNDAAHARTMQKGRPFMKNVFLDCGRKFFSVANIERIIDTMTTVDLRNLVLDFSNHNAFRFSLDDMNITTEDGITYDISQCLATDYLTETDMDTIISYAKANNVNIIGGVNVPGHISALAAPFFGVASLNLDSEKQKQFGIAVTEKYAEYFESKGCQYYYLGGDESGAHSKYGEFMNRAMHTVLKHNMIPLIWNDQICRSDGGEINEPYINDGAICMFWGANNQSATTIEKNNFQQINSSMAIYWTLGSSSKPTTETISNFNINIFQGNSTIRKNIAGAQFCMWMDGVGGSDDLDNDGTDVVTRCIPLIETFGNTIMAQTNDAHTTTYRPLNPSAGDFYFDTTINKPIWWNGSSWVDSMGTNV